MNIRLGIYDVFSRIVPGGFYLLAFVLFASVLNWIRFDWQLLLDISAITSLGFFITAYIIGTAMDPFGAAWHRLFGIRGMSARILSECKSVHDDRWILDFEEKDWPILRAYIGIHNPDAASDIDRNNALCIMLRNVSLGLVMITISALIKFAETFEWSYVVSSILLLVFSYETAIRAKTLRHWFYSGMIETIMAFRLNLEERVRPKDKRKRNP